MREIDVNQQSAGSRQSFNITSDIKGNEKKREFTELPIFGLPQNLQDIIAMVSKGYDSPREFSVVSAFAVISTVVGKNVLSNDGVHENFSSCWFCIVANSGVGKSDPQKFFTKPLLEADRKSFEQYRADCKHYESLSKEEQQQTEKPRFSKFLLDDSTPEKRNEYLSYNNGMLQNTDELKGFFDNTNRYSKSGEISQLLSISDNTSFACDRVSKESMLVDSPFLNILGGIQPNMLHKCFSEGLIDNGFIYRFLFVYHNGNGQRTFGRKQFNTKELQTQWSAFLYDLQTHYSNQTELCFSDEALNLIYDYGNNVVNVNKQNTADDRVCATYDKSMVCLERVALITAIANKRVVITADDVRYALACTNYFVSCTLQVLQKIDSSNAKQIPLSTQELIGRFFERFPELKVLQATMNKAIGKTDSYFQAMFNKYISKKERSQIIQNQ